MNKRQVITLTLLAIMVAILSYLAVFKIIISICESKNDDGMDQIREIIEYNKELEYTKIIYDRCSKLETGEEKFRCVGNYLVENVEYVNRDEIYSIDDMFDLGADCKSYALYYATFADMFGYDYSFFWTPNHVTALADFEEGYCLLDGEIVMCLDYQDTNSGEEE